MDNFNEPTPAEISSRNDPDSIPTTTDPGPMSITRSPQITNSPKTASDGSQITVVEVPTPQPEGDNTTDADASRGNTHMPMLEDHTPHADDSLEQFQDFLDSADENIQLLDNVGKKKISIILFRNYEFRTDRRAVREKQSQLWVCRWAGKYRCKCKLVLDVEDPQNITRSYNATLIGEHNHQPYRPESYGFMEFTEIREDGPQQPTEDDGANDVSRDYRVALEEGLTSSPIIPLSAQQNIGNSDPDELTTILLDTSEYDVRGLVCQKFVRVPRSTVDREPMDVQPSTYTQTDYTALSEITSDEESDQEFY